MLNRSYIYTGALAAIALGVYLLRLWQPETQVSKHSEHLIVALADKNWEKFGDFIADNYRDQWENDRSAVRQRTREIFQYLRKVKIGVAAPRVRVEGDRGYWTSNIVIEGGDDNEVMTVLKERVNHLPSPFELEWQHMSGKPWDWKLVAVRNPALTIPTEY